MPNSWPSVFRDLLQSARRVSDEQTSHRLSASTRGVILVLRVTAALIATAVLAIAWRMTVALPWEIDGLIVAVAVLAWGYWFERGEGN